MNQVSLTGKDVFILNDRHITGLADGDCVLLEYPNQLAAVKKGKNGNTIYAFNETGDLVNVTVRCLLGCADDKFFSNLLIQQKSNPEGFVLMAASLVKRVGDGQGNVTPIKYTMSGGIFTDNVAGKMNAEADTNQAVVEYKMTFSNAPRIIG